jgi:acetolactate decarboxylase
VLEFLQSLLLQALLQQQPHKNTDAVYQLSTIRALVDGSYEGVMRYSEIAKHGDFGLGTFDSLDGEMVALDGRFFQIKSDGSLSTVRPDQTAPFAIVKFFNADKEFRLHDEQTLDSVEKLIDEHCPRNVFVAVRIKGTFKSLKLRAVKRQEAPFVPLSQLKNYQEEFSAENIRGELVGFRFPKFAEPMTLGGYHLHFIDDNFHFGGHVLSASVADADIKLDLSSDFHVELPMSSSALNADLDSDQSNLIHDVESKPIH